MTDLLNSKDKIKINTGNNSAEIQKNLETDCHVTDAND